MRNDSLRDPVPDTRTRGGADNPFSDPNLTQLWNAAAKRYRDPRRLTEIVLYAGVAGITPAELAEMIDAIPGGD